MEAILVAKIAVYSLGLSLGTFLPTTKDWVEGTAAYKLKYLGTMT